MIEPEVCPIWLFESRRAFPEVGGAIQRRNRGSCLELWAGKVVGRFAKTIAVACHRFFGSKKGNRNFPLASNPPAFGRKCGAWSSI